jgi:AP-4 complex subunit beta-1
MRSLTAVMTPAPPAVGGGGGLFVDHKKGEIPELKNLLRDSAVDKDPKHKRAVMERVVGYMTLGIDMSPLFSEMIMATATKDLVQKKMCYLYLSNYASLQPEMALLVINTLQKDARDQDPMVRGLALRCLCSLHVENVLEYLIDPVLKGLLDVSGYVRKTAVMCVLRLRELSPDVIADRQLVHELFYLLNDRDPQVAANAVQAILELQGEAGVRLLCNKAVVVALLKRLRDFNEWSQCLILKVVAEFKAESAEEAFEIMNFLDERLRHCNAAIVVATVKVFFNLSADNPAIQKQVIERTKAPLVSLMTAASSEVAFVLLKHMHLLVQHAPGVYDDEFSSFFVRYSDALYVQNIKIKMLVLLTNDTNFMSIVDELSALVSPHDATLSKVAIQALGDIAVSYSPSSYPPRPRH